jgi:hypothetical protein
MRTYYLSTVLAIASYCMLAGPRALRADYILGGGETLGVYRIDDNGSLIGFYVPPPDVADDVETYGEDYAVTPDLKTLYQFTNSLRYSDLIFAFDVGTRNYLRNRLLDAPCCYYTAGDNTLILPRMSLIRANDTFEAGDLFSISSYFGLSGSTPKIKRYNRTTDTYVESLEPPTTQRIYDFAFGPANTLYMAAAQGIFVYVESITGFELFSPTPLIGSTTGTITFGPDGLLYVRDVTSGNVSRYTDQGQFVDTFIPASSIPEHYGSLFDLPARGSIQFGVDGNLHLFVQTINPADPFSNNQLIAKYDGSDGSLLEVIPLGELEPFYPLYAFGRVTYVPAVPEPNGLLLAMFAASMMAGQLRRR